MALNLVVSMLTARYLGPSNYGLINYAASIVAFLIPVMQLGLRSTLVQEFVDAPDREGKILGTAIALNIAGALACIAAVFSFTSVVNASEPETILICVLYSVSLLFQAVEIIQYWFQAKLMAKYPSVAMLFSYVAVSAYKIFLLITGKSVYWFAVSHAIDFAIISAVLVVVYLVKGEQKLGFSFRLAGKMLSRSKYYIVSGLMVNVFQLTDRVMLKHMAGDEMTGLYSAAVACSGITIFVFNAIIDSYRPSILQKFKSGESEAEDETATLYSVVIYLSLLQCVAIDVLAKPLVLLLYGQDYVGSVGALRIVTWFTLFSVIGTVRNIWILAHGRQRVLLVVNLCGAVMNIGLNLVLIPVIGMIGASVASVVCQCFANVVVTEFIPGIRRNNRILLMGLDPRRLVRFAGGILRKK